MTTRTITITVLDDDDDDAMEQKSFTVTLRNAVNADLGDATATGTITDDDVPGVTASFEQATYTVAEGSTVTVKVTLSADPERTVTIPLTATGQDRGHGLGLLRRARQHDLQQRRHGAVLHVHGH